MFAFTMLCILSWFLTGADSEGAKFRWLNTILQLACFPFLAYYIASNSRYSEHDLKRLLSGVMIIQSYLVFTGLAEYYHISWLIWPKYVSDLASSGQSDRVTGPFANGGILGAALVMNLVCLCVMTSNTRGAKRIYLNTLTLLSCACIYLTNTRAVWIGLGVVLIVLGFAETRLRVVARNIGLCLLVAALIGVGSKFSVFEPTLFSRRQNTIEYRVENLTVGLRVFTEAPLFGVGYGGFARNMLEYENVHGDEENALTAGNENTWLGILVDLGLVGLVLYLAIYVALIRSAVRILRNHTVNPVFVRQFAAVALAMLLYMMANWNAGDLRFHLYDPCMTFLMNGILAGLAAGTREKAVSTNNQAFEPEISQAVT